MPNQESKIRIGIVGLGFARHVHVPAFRRQAGCVVAAICGSSAGRAERAAAELGIPCAASSWREMVEDPSIAALVIAVPPVLQPEIAIEAALRGKHLFCEKPLGVSLRQIEELVDVAGARRVVHAVDFLFPEIPAWARAREMLATIGTIQHIVLSWRLETRAHRVGARSWKVIGDEGGGTLSTFVSHSFYYLEWMFGPIIRLTARLHPRRGDADTVADLWMELESGAAATGSVSAAAHLGPGHRLEVYGSNGTLLLKNTTSDYVNGFELYAGGRSATGLERIAVEDAAQDGDGRIAAVAKLAGRFLAAIKSGGSVEPNLMHGLRVQRLLDAARVANEGERWIDVAPGAAR